ncbi:MAG TPA: dihydrolipoamide acetyltransferase family protein [Trueperaceae bacterium]|nr:dihydrolipoamide acetyltransferase family protein [Trueperaceae bacterium]
MPRELLLPELAESVVEGEIVKWLAAEGETVVEDQPVVEVMTDKVTVELPSPYSGVLEKHLAAEGDVVKVHQAIALFADDVAAATAGDGAPAKAATGQGATSVQAAEERSIVESGAQDEPDDGDSLSLFKPGDKGEDGPVYTIKRPAGGGDGAVSATSATVASRGQATPEAPTARGPHGRVLAVPAARKLARELDIDIAGVPGSGPNGRVRVDDVRSHAAGDGLANGVAGAATLSKRGKTVHKTPDGYEELEERVPVRGLRRVIANQMVASHLQTVRTLHVDEADVSDLVRLRERLKPAAAKRGVKLSYLPFIMKAVAAALDEYPALNSSLDEDANEIVLKHYVNLGLAVATAAGLVVPVVHDVPNRSFLELADEVDRLATAARDGTLTADDVKGGTFSITNIGSLGGLFSFPIINVPEAAILGVHTIKKRPVVLADDSIVARSMIYLSLSFDHRLVDGAEGAMFTGRVIQLLETPEELFLDL